MVQVLNQDETPLLYSLVFGEGVVNDATSVVLFNAVESLDLASLDYSVALLLIGNFFYLFVTSTMLGVFVSLSLSLSVSTSFSLSHFFLSVASFFEVCEMCSDLTSYFFCCRLDFLVPTLSRSYILEGNIIVSKILCGCVQVPFCTILVFYVVFFLMQ